jgi:ABC-type uncharacterized transport system substrate-binding protein
VNRRGFIAVGLLATLIRRGSAQEAGRTYRLGTLAGVGRDAPQWVAFFDELSKAGFVEGKNLVVDPRGFGIDYARAPAVAADIVTSGADVIITGGGPMPVGARAATRTIPILALSDDMVAEGLVPSLQQPGGNLTGISILATELDGKRQEILMELLPAARYMGVLVDPGNSASLQLETLQKFAASRGVELAAYPAADAEEIGAAVERAQAVGVTALNVLASPLLNLHRRVIIERTATRHLPAIYQWPETATEGGLIAYGPSFLETFRQLARQSVRVLRGAKPQDVPVEQPTKFKLVINLKTAQALGLTVPQSLFARADEVIE